MPEDVASKFEAAWRVFAATCSQFIAPEPTYQAWFAHYLISQFGIDRVAREPMVKKEAFTETPWKAKVIGNHVRLDVVVTRTPGIHLPHYANRHYRAADGTGLERLRPMAIISELKVTATQGEGQDHGEVARDAYKLSMLLDELRRSGVSDDDLPLAYYCILDNHPKMTYSRATSSADSQRCRTTPMSDSSCTRHDPTSAQPSPSPDWTCATRRNIRAPIGNRREGPATSTCRDEWAQSRPSGGGRTRFDKSRRATPRLRL